MGSVTVRAAEQQDLPQLCQVRNTPPLYLGYLDECDGQAAHFLVAELDGRIVGFGVVYLAVTKTGKKKSHLPKLSDLYVLDAYRRRGVATALIQARERLAKQAGHSEIFVSIDPVESAEMIALAKKLAYRPIQAEPYAVDATYYDADGRPYAKRYFRLDFTKRLDLEL
jgi:GNAT superfamily N-acetyltransferase